MRIFKTHNQFGDKVKNKIKNTNNATPTLLASI
jgi:uncharacterized protein YdcH (DUF465 family)